MPDCISPLTINWDNLIGEPLWLSGKVEKNEKINEIKRPWVRSPPQATSFFLKKTGKI
jgi:hypothetical protein